MLHIGESKTRTVHPVKFQRTLRNGKTIIREGQWTKAGIEKAKSRKGYKVLEVGEPYEEEYSEIFF